MALAAWWRGDALPELIIEGTLTVHPAAGYDGLAELNHISRDEVRRRCVAGHHPYIALVDGVPAAHGWVAVHRGEIGELGLDFAVPSDNRYLWDFATLPQWQGRGIYPRLLQAVIAAEGAVRYWIIYAPENLPSGMGIEKAGFASVGQLSFRRDGSVGLAPLAGTERAQAGAALLGVPLLEDQLSPCWRCVGKVVCACQSDPSGCTCALPVHHSPAGQGTGKNKIR